MKREQVKAFLDALGVEYEEDGEPEEGENYTLTIRPEQDKVDGYYGHYVVFEFDENDEFINMRICNWD